MKIRSLKYYDVDKVLKLCKEQGFNPSRKNSVTERVILDEDNLVGYGIVNILAEAVMALDLNASRRKRIIALHNLMQIAIADCQLREIDQLHVFVKDPKLIPILKKHYGFVECSGTPMVLNLD